MPPYAVLVYEQVLVAADWTGGAARPRGIVRLRPGKQKRYALSNHRQEHFVAMP